MKVICIKNDTYLILNKVYDVETSILNDCYEILTDNNYSGRRLFKKSMFQTIDEYRNDVINKLL